MQCSGADLHHVGFFFARELFHATNFFVGHLLNFFDGALLVVFADLLFFGELLEGVVAVATNVANSGAVLFEDAVEVFDDVAAAFFGHGRNGNAEELAIRDRIEAEIGSLNRFFNLFDDRGIVGLDEDGLRLRRGDLRHLRDGSGRAVVVHLDCIEHVSAGAAGARDARLD